MVRFDSDHINWVLVVMLVALALLLAMAQSVGYGDVTRAAKTTPTTQATQPRWGVLVESRNELKEAVPPSQAWYAAREMYRAGKYAEAREEFDRVGAVYSYDPAARMWAGMAAYRTGDRAAALEHWEWVWEEADLSEHGIWPAIALVAVHLELDRVHQAADLIVPLQREIGIGDHPIVSYYAALVYERLAGAAPEYRDAVEDSLAEELSPALATNDPSMVVSPNSRSWLVFLTKRSLERTVRAARRIDWTAPTVPGTATVEPSLAPTVEELLEALGSADFANKARERLRAVRVYELLPIPKHEIFDAPTRDRFVV